MVRRTLPYFVIAVGIAASIATPRTIATDLGSLARTYPIDEPDMIELIQARLKKLEAEGKLKEIEEKAKERVTRSVKNPARVIGITTAKQNRTYLFDPSIVTTEPIEDGKGNVIVPVGTKINPLQHISLDKDLIFFDGDDKRQIEWAKRYVEAHPATKPILIGGPLFDTMKQMSTWLYFDQQGYITGRLGISAVPATVTQEGEHLRVNEIANY